MTFEPSDPAYVNWGPETYPTSRKQAYAMLEKSQDIGEDLASIGRTVGRIKSERDALLKACIFAHERLLALEDAGEATRLDLRALAAVKKAIEKATGVRP